MTTETPEVIATSPRSEAMRRAWLKRRAIAAMETEWFSHPVCLCGCDGPLVRQKNPNRQSYFLRGHDARLQSLAGKVLRGEASKDEIPEMTKALRNFIGFLKKMPELQKAFE